MHTFKYKSDNVQNDNITKLKNLQTIKNIIGDDGTVLSLNVTFLKIFFCRAEIESNIDGYVRPQADTP